MTAGSVRGSLERDPRDGQDPDTPVVTRGLEGTGRALGAAMWLLSGIYEFGVDGYGRWIALRRDGQAALIGACPESLLAAIRADCAPPGGDAG